MACFDSPREHRRNPLDTNSPERTSGEMTHRSDVVGIFTNDKAIAWLLGALRLEQNDEWSIQ